MAQTILDQFETFRGKRDDESVGEYVDAIQAWLDGRSMAEEEVLSRHLGVRYFDLSIEVAARKMGVSPGELEGTLEREEEIREDLEDDEWNDEEDDEGCDE